METILKIGQREPILVKNEKISGFYVSLDALKADGVTLADLVAPEDIKVNIILVTGSKREYLHQTDLAKFVVANFDGLAVSTQYLASDVRHFYFPLGGSIALSNNKYIQVELDFKKSAFTDIDVANSSLSFETEQSQFANNIVNKTENLPIREGSKDFTIDLGSRVTKVQFYANPIIDDVYYEANAATNRLVDIDISSPLYNAKKSERLAFYQNFSFGFSNYENIVNLFNLTLFQSNQMINGAKLKASAVKATTTDEYIIVTRKINV